jgi:ABC-type glycerol-3-phosphate transport system substrate-binding protein
MKRVVVALLLGAVGLAACSDGKVEDADKAAAYQGKPDIHAWDSPADGGAKAEWERKIETRTLGQNEYTRTQ